MNELANLQSCFIFEGFTLNGSDNLFMKRSEKFVIPTVK